jgi:hypothetical protein
MSDFQTKPGTGTAFAMKRPEGDKRPVLEVKVVLDRDYRKGEELKLVAWKKDKPTSNGNVQFSVKVSEPMPGGPQQSGRSMGDDIPF